MSEKAKLSNVLAHAHYAASFDAQSDDEIYDPKKEALVRSMLQEIGEDPYREGLRRTPLRVAKAMDFLTSGYQLSAEEIIKKARLRRGRKGDGGGARHRVLLHV